MIPLLISFLFVSLLPIAVAVASRKFTPQSPNIILHFLPYHRLAALFIEPIPAHFFVIRCRLRKQVPVWTVFQKALPHLKDNLWVLHGNSPIRRIMEQARMIANRRFSYSKDTLELLCLIQLSCPDEFSEFVKEYPALSAELEELTMHEKTALAEHFRSPE